MTKEYILNFLTTHKKEMQDTYALKKIGLGLERSLRPMIKNNIKDTIIYV